MKKVVVILSVLLIFAFITLTAYADTSAKYSIKDWHIYAVINQDGSMNVKEYITYRVSSKHEGPVQRNIDISRASYVEDLNVFGVTTMDPEDITRSEVDPYKLVDKPEQYAEGTYALKPGANPDEIQEVQIYLPRDADEKTIVLSYKLHDFVFLYRDTAAIFWNPIITGYGNNVDNIDIRFSLPKGAGIDAIHSFVYGALNGESQTLENGIINITGYELQPEEFMEVVLLFPKSVVGEGRKLIDNDVVQKILQEQQAKMEEMELLRQKREQEQRFRTTVTIIVVAGILGIGICGCLLYIRHHRSKKDKKKADKVSKHMPLQYNVSGKVKKLLRENGTRSRDMLAQIVKKIPNKKDEEMFDNLPADYYTPAELSVLLRGRRITPRDVVATLIDLVVRRYLELEAVVKDDDKHYILRLKDFEPNSLKAHEEYLVNWFFKDIGDGNEVSTEAIRQAAYASGVGGEFHTKFIIWKRLVVNQARRWKFRKRESVLRQYKRTEFGEKHYREWMKFKKFLKGLNREANSVPLVKWETYLVYAFPLGIARRVVKTLKMALASGAPIDDGLTILNGSNFHAIDEWFNLINNFSFIRNGITRQVQRISSISWPSGKNRDRTM